MARGDDDGVNVRVIHQLRGITAAIAEAEFVACVARARARGRSYADRLNSGNALERGDEHGFGEVTGADHTDPDVPVGCGACRLAKTCERDCVARLAGARVCDYDAE